MKKLQNVKSLQSERAQQSTQQAKVELHMLLQSGFVILLYYLWN